MLVDICPSADPAAKACRRPRPIGHAGPPAVRSRGPATGRAESARSAWSSSAEIARVVGVAVAVADRDDPCGQLVELRFQARQLGEVGRRGHERQPTMTAPCSPDSTSAAAPISAGALARPDVTAPTPSDDDALRRRCARIIAEVRAGGDAAVRELTERFDGCALDDLRVPADELRGRARRGARPSCRAALEVAADAHPRVPRGPARGARAARSSATASSCASSRCPSTAPGSTCPAAAPRTRRPCS